MTQDTDKEMQKAKTSYITMNGSEKSPGEVDDSQAMMQRDGSHLGYDASDSLYMLHQKTLRKKKHTARANEEEVQLANFRMQASSTEGGSAINPLPVVAMRRKATEEQDILVPKIKRRKKTSKSKKKKLNEKPTAVAPLCLTLVQYSDDEE